MRKFFVRLILALLVTVIAAAGLLQVAKIVINARFHAKWDDVVDRAEIAVADFLSDRANLHPYPTGPEQIPTELGAFVELQGEGYRSPVWNIQGYDYVSARRMARFTNGDLPVWVHVASPGDVATMSPFIRDSSWGTGISEGDFGQQVDFKVFWK